MLIRPLSKRHDTKGFDCGNDDLNRWLVQIAGQHGKKLVSKTFVAAENETASEILGYYAIGLLELRNEELPANLQQRLPRQVPAFRLGRLAVSSRHQGKKIREFMLFDAIDRVTRISEEAGGVGLVVDAKDSAIGFYQRYGFETMADHPNRMILAIRAE